MALSRSAVVLSLLCPAVALADPTTGATRGVSGWGSLADLGLEAALVLACAGFALMLSASARTS